MVITMVFGAGIVYAESEADEQQLHDVFEMNRIRELEIIEAAETGEEIPQYDLIDIPSGNSPRWICEGCESLILSTCFADAILHDQGTHKYLGKECTQSIFYSRGGYVCQYCGHVTMISGYHWCWDVHTTCPIGTQDVCTMDNS